MIAGKKRIAPYLPYLRSKGRFSFGCTVLFSFLRAVPAAFIGGWTRGLMMPSVTGVLMGREIIRQENI